MTSGKNGVKFREISSHPIDNPELGDGVNNCEDDDECFFLPCSENGTCENTVGSFTCTCNEFYSGKMPDFFKIFEKSC